LIRVFRARRGMRTEEPEDANGGDLGNGRWICRQLLISRINSSFQGHPALHFNVPLQGQGRPLPTTIACMTRTQYEFHGTQIGVCTWLHPVSLSFSFCFIFCFPLSFSLFLSLSLVLSDLSSRVPCISNSSDSANELVKVTRGKVVSGQQLQNQEFLENHGEPRIKAIDVQSIAQVILRKVCEN